MAESESGICAMLLRTRCAARGRAVCDSQQETDHDRLSKNGIGREVVARAAAGVCGRTD